ncbi:hypothetical protein [Brevibacillus laterosporus]|uniref:hypothetical protein n=1 Tax=Brevibacillus laterosporus TaxID=1465 RepID=UPI003D210E4F
MELTFREEVAKSFMEERFLPALHKLISTINPKEYEKWGGNACRQTAIFGSLYLERLLPEYTWSMWDGIFNDIVNDRKVTYNHAWLYGVNKENGKRLLVDLSRVHHERLFIVVTGNRYPKDHPSYKDMVEISRKKLNARELMKLPEYYTDLKVGEFLTKLEAFMAEDAK